MNAQKTGTWMVVLVAVLALAPAARADWLDNFDQPTFDARWNFDEPNPALGTVTLDTVNDYAHFQANGNTDMWTVRKDAPIMWTPSGQTFYMETHVMTSTTQTGSVAGITVYGSPDGSKPNFGLGLNQWGSATGLVHLQGLGTNNPNNSVSALGGGEAWLRLECLADGGAGGVDLYTAKYKLNVGDPWSTLATLDRDVPDGRMGLFLKTSGGGRSADFSYAAGSDPPAPPMPIQGGDVIKLDFSNAGDGDGGSLADWNRTTGAGATIPAGSVIRHGDGAVIPGVGISFSGGGTGDGNDGASANWPGTGADPYYILAADDIYFGPNARTTMFSGLDLSLTYNVRIYSLIGNNAGFVERFTVTDGAGTQFSQATRTARWTASTLEAGGTVFAGLSPDAGGNLSVTVQGVSNIYYPLNAIVLEAVAPPTVIPEPVTMLAVVLGVSGLGGYIRKRRAGREG